MDQGHLPNPKINSPVRVSKKNMKLGQRPEAMGQWQPSCVTKAPERDDTRYKQRLQPHRYAESLCDFWQLLWGSTMAEERESSGVAGHQDEMSSC